MVMELKMNLPTPHTEPITPKAAAIILDMWSKQLDTRNPDVKHIATRLHDLANSLVSTDD